MLVLQKYDFEIEYINCKDNTVCDTLSRAPLEHCSLEITPEDMNSHVNLVMSNLPISEAKLKKIMNETVKDDTLICLKRQIEKDWPDYRKNVDEKTMCYYNNRHELTIQYGLILKGDRIIVPSTTRQEMLSLIHHGHQGIEKIKKSSQICCVLAKYKQTIRRSCSMF